MGEQCRRLGVILFPDHIISGVHIHRKHFDAMPEEPIKLEMGLSEFLNAILTNNYYALDAASRKAIWVYTLFRICDKGLGTLDLEPFNLAVIKARNADTGFMGTRSIGLTFIR